MKKIIFTLILLSISAIIYGQNFDTTGINFYSRFDTIVVKTYNKSASEVYNATLGVATDEGYLEHKHLMSALSLLDYKISLKINKKYYDIYIYKEKKHAKLYLLSSKKIIHNIEREFLKKFFSKIEKNLEHL